MNVGLLRPVPFCSVHKYHNLQTHRPPFAPTIVSRAWIEQRCRWTASKGARKTGMARCSRGARDCGSEARPGDLVPRRLQITPDNPDVQRDAVPVAGRIPRPGRRAVNLDRQLEEREQTTGVRRIAQPEVEQQQRLPADAHAAGSLHLPVGGRPLRQQERNDQRSSAARAVTSAEGHNGEIFRKILA
jgi:hypothetical protein